MDLSSVVEVTARLNLKWLVCGALLEELDYSWHKRTASRQSKLQPNKKGGIHNKYSGCSFPVPRLAVWHTHRTREAPTASPKSMPISGTKNEPSGITRCCSESNRQISKCGNTSLYIAKFWSVQTCNFFSVESRTYRISYSHFKSCTVALWFFSIYFLEAKTEKLTKLLLY